MRNNHAWAWYLHGNERFFFFFRTSMVGTPWEMNKFLWKIPRVFLKLSLFDGLVNFQGFKLGNREIFNLKFLFSYIFFFCFELLIFMDIIINHSFFVIIIFDYFSSNKLFYRKDNQFYFLLFTSLLENATLSLGTSITGNKESISWKIFQSLSFF